MSKPSQADRILAALARSGRRGITQVDFLLPDVIDGGPPITRVPARVKELRNLGIQIHHGGSRDKCRVFRLLDSFYDEDPNTGCWVWNGARTAGYARIGDEYGHRVMYERSKGPIPEGFDIDHLCRNPPCVNPNHLEAVSHPENIRRGDAAKLSHEDVQLIRASSASSKELAEAFGVTRTSIWRIRNGGGWGEPVTKGPANFEKTHCKRGHEFTAENTYEHSDGRRECRTCRKAASEARRYYPARVEPAPLEEPAPPPAALFELAFDDVCPPPRNAILGEEAA